MKLYIKQRKRSIRFAAVLLTLALAFSLCACAGKESGAGPGQENDPAQQTGTGDARPAVTVDGVTYTVEEVRRELDSYVQTAASAGMRMSDAEIKEAAEAIADRFVIRGLAEAELRTMKKWELTDSELYELRSSAQKKYEAMWQYFRDLPASAGMTDAELTDYLTQNGLSLSLMVDELALDARLKRLLTLKGVSAEIDDDALDAYYEENMVAPARERYEGNIDLFESEVLQSGDATMVWVPDGYRMLYQIVLPVPQELRDKMDGIMEQAQAAAEEAQELYDRIAALAIAGKDVSRERDAYNEKMDEIDDLEIGYASVWAEVKSACEEQAKEIYARLESGEKFEKLMQSFSGEHVLLYHRDSGNWPDTFRASADSMTAPGDVSPAALCEDGAHILYYVRDMEGGALPLEGNDRELLREQAASEILYQRLKTLTDPWRRDHTITVDIDAIIN